jgi:RND superfamily putative drug exporter
LAAERQRLEKDAPVDLTLGISGSTAVGGDLLLAAAESIQHTETWTIVLVIAILMVVYRSPLLIIVPLLTSGVSLSLSIGILALLTQLHCCRGSIGGIQGFHDDQDLYRGHPVRIGERISALFLIARLREEFSHSQPGTYQAVSSALTKVGDALVASAFTTIMGLAMMYFRPEFGKFRNSGPAIGLCLLITLLACLTFAPALLTAMGSKVFWPFKVDAEGASSERNPQPAGTTSQIWW